MVKQKYIGGNFTRSDLALYKVIDQSQLEQYFPEKIGNLQRNYFQTGADAIAQICREINQKNKILWFPSNFCEETIVRVKLKSGINDIGRYLHLSEVLNFDASCNVVIVVHFNSFNNDIAQQLSKLRGKENLFFVEDFVHAPLEIKEISGDYAFNSLRKIVYTDVAVAYCRERTLFTIHNSLYQDLKEKASETKSKYLETSDPFLETEFLDLYEQAEKSLTHPEIQGAYDPNLRCLNSIDFNKIKAKRKENFESLRGMLIGNEKIKILPGEYFYLIAKCLQRDDLRKYLFSNSVSAPIHWSDSNSQISKDLISLPIDQRYDQQDMTRLAALINNFYAKK